MNKLRLLFLSVLLIVFISGCERHIEKEIENVFIGTVNQERVFVWLSDEDDKLLGELVFSGSTAFTKKILFEGEKGNDSIYSVSLRYKRKRIKFDFIGEINKDNILGNISIEEKYLKRLNILPDQKIFPINLSLQKTKTIPDIGGRYTSSTFDSVSVRKNIFYGRADGYYKTYPIDKTSTVDYFEILTGTTYEAFLSIGSLPLNLYFDLYEPNGDTLKYRPLLFLIHGGAFIIGDKETPTIVTLANDFARKGYVVVSVDYRMGFNPLSTSSMERSSYKALQDIRAALRYLVHFSELYRIDVDNIVIGGTSAGAITALNAAFMEDSEKLEGANGSWWKIQSDLGCIDCSTNDYKDTFSLRGVINMWGAVNDINIIDNYEQIPIISFHGTEDKTVAFGYDYPFTDIDKRILKHIIYKLYGSKPIAERADYCNIKNELITFEGYDHEPHITPNGFNSNLDTIIDYSTSFLDEVTYPLIVLSGQDSILKDDSVPYYMVDLIDGYKYFWKVNGGMIVSENELNNRVGVVFYEKKNLSVECSVVNHIGKVVKVSKNIVLE